MFDMVLTTPLREKEGDVWRKMLCMEINILEYQEMLIYNWEFLNGVMDTPNHPVAMDHDSVIHIYPIFYFQVAVSMIFLQISKYLSQNDEGKCEIDFSTQVTTNGVDFSGCKLYWDIRNIGDNRIVLDKNNSYPFKIAYVEYSPYITEESGSPKGMMFGEYAQKRSQLNLCFIPYLLNTRH